MKKYLIIIAIVGLILLLTILVIISNSFGKKSNQDTQSFTNPVPEKIAYTRPAVTIIPQTVNALPTFTPDQGMGIDTNSQPIQESSNNVQSLSAYLPYSKEIQTTDGMSVSVLIPTKELQDNEWTLNIQIFGPDYNVNQSDPTYTQNKQAFLIAVNNTFEWIKSHNVDPKKLVITWGDRKFIQDKAEEWLKSQ